MPIPVAVQTVAPTVRPVTLADLKDHCRVSGGDEDSLLDGLILAATEYVQTALDRQLVTATWTLTLPALPSEITLPWPPLATVTSVKYYDSGNVLQTLATSQYQVVKTNVPGRIIPAYNVTWPDTYDRADAVVVTYTSGQAVASVPAAAKQTILLLAAHWYANREAVSQGPTMAPVPLALDSLIQSLRSYRF
jgi:uncharacterized phiE125 gp8 family phage protein